MWEALLDPVLLLFILVLATVIAAMVVMCMAIFAHAGGQSADRSERKSWSSMIQKKDERIVQMDEDYKALVESYLRETGKVYVRPANVQTGKLQPASPNAWRMKPPPPMKTIIDVNEKGED